MFVLSAQRFYKVLFNDSFFFFSNIRFSIVYFEYDNLYQLSLGLEMLGGGQDYWKL